MSESITVYPGQKIQKPTVEQLIKAGIQKRVEKNPTLQKDVKAYLEGIVSKMNKFDEGPSAKDYPTFARHALRGGVAMAKFILDSDPSFFETLMLSNETLKALRFPALPTPGKDTRKIEVRISDTQDILSRLRRNEDGSPTVWFGELALFGKQYLIGALALLCHLLGLPIDKGGPKIDFWQYIGINEISGLKQ